MFLGGYHWAWGFLFVIAMFVKWGHCSLASVQCVQVGQANLNSLNQEGTGTTGAHPVPGPNGYGILYLNDTRRHGYWTIGTRKFDTTHVFLDNSLRNTWFDESVQDCPYYMPPENGRFPYVKLFFNPCPNDSLVTIKTYAVKQDGVVMKGWLHFEVELTDKTDKILGIYVQIRDDVFNAIGKFVQEPEEQCSPTKPYLATQSPYQVLPCSAVGRREAEIANALFMVRPDFLRDRAAGERFLPDNDISRGIHFTWRMSEYWCNRHLRIRPEALIFTEKMRAKNIFQTTANIECNSCETIGPYRKAAEYWLYHGWYGTEDLKLPATKLTCDEEVIDYKTGTLKKKADGTLVAPWLQDKVMKSQLGNDYFAANQRYQDPRTHWQTLKSCQFDTRLVAPNPPMDKLLETVPDIAPTFAGRCIYDWKKEVSHDNLQGCDDPPTAEQFQALPDMPAYGEFVHNLTVNRSNLCSFTECAAPSNATHLEQILGYPDTSGERVFILKDNFNNKSLSESRGSKFWSGRKFHAILAVIVTMFILPVGTFAARYLKETYMDQACMGVHAWFWIHLVSAVASMIGLVAAFNTLWSVINSHGRSIYPPASLHRMFGYSSFGFFFLMIIVGGFRTGWDPVQRMMRITCMSIHAVIGFTQYYFAVAAILTSTLIPASPIIDGDNCLDDGTVKHTPAVITVTAIWIGVDFIFHIFMTALLVLVDRQVHIRRHWYCPFVPILPTTSTTDLKGAFMRKIGSLAYVGVAGVLTLANVGILAGNELSEDCSNRIGPMSCDMNSPFGCQKFHKDFLSIMLSTGENRTAEGDLI